MSRLLDQAAAAYGIERAFIDNSGQVHRTTPETQRALLEAMGVPAGSTGELREAIERAAATDAVPPVLVAAAGEDTEVAVPGAASGEWRLALEGGDTLQGALRRDGRKRRVLLPEPLPVGYHRLVLPGPGGAERSVLIVAAPPRCASPEELGADRVFGLGCQVYGLRGRRDLGVGDLAALAELAGAAAREGADFLALNPLHALFFADPTATSPYSPSNRAFLNWLLVAPELVPEAEIGPTPPLPKGELVAYPEAAAARRRLLEAAFARFRARHLEGGETELGAAYRRFVAAGGEALRRHCLFDALHERQLAADPGRWAWWTWPEAYRRPDYPEVEAFAREHEERVAFLAWLQWQAKEQLARVQSEARRGGMRLGLYRDLAVGVNPGGSLGWAKPEVVIRRASIGAPPDAFSPLGQNWGIAPFAPRALQEQGFEPWIADIRANMREAGALRIDHVMGLRRLFWIPEGAGPAEGAYVRYPFSSHLAILALESQRARCLVVGEDLGTVPRGFRPALRRAGVLSSRVLYFERERGGAFGSARRYRPASVASVGTHDLPTLAGFLAEQDIGWRERLALFPSPEVAAEARRERRRDRERLWRLLRRAGLVPADAAPDPETVALAVHRWLARTPAALLQVSLEDLTLQAEQPNLPGTVDQHPNWRRRYPGPAGDLLDHPFARRLLAALREERPRGAAGGDEKELCVRLGVSGR